LISLPALLLAGNKTKESKKMNELLILLAAVLYSMLGIGFHNLNAVAHRYERISATIDVLLWPVGLVVYAILGVR